MPYKPAHSCNQPGCGRLTYQRYCADHEREYERERGSASKRGYGRGWQGIRKKYLLMYPMCQGEGEAGLGCDKVATEVHHIVSLRRGGSNAYGNLKGLCKACHSRETMKEINKRNTNTG